MSELPSTITYAVVGAGIHGLSTAWHLAMELQARGKGSGGDIVVLDKTGPGAGASGIACGLVRNFYMNPVLHPILRHSLDVWTYDPISFGFQQVGYVSCGEANQQTDYERIYESQNAVGYHSDLYVGAEARAFLTSVWPDCNTDRIDVVLHEKLSGYAGTSQAIKGLTEKCLEHGVRIVWNAEVTGYDIAGGLVKKLHTSRGDVACDAVVLGAGPFTGIHWQMLGLPMTLDMGYADGTAVEGHDMWTYWRLRETELYIDTPYRSADGKDPPIFKAELMTTPVTDPETGEELEGYVYFYVKNASERLGRLGLQGGGIPIKLGPEAQVDPYGHASKRYLSEPEYDDYFCAALGQLLPRFAGCRKDVKKRPAGGIGAFTPDNMPIFDWVLPNVYMIADSNHGFKMTGVGKLVARLLAGDNKVAELEPFALDRYARGRSFGASNSHSPWV